MAAEQQVILRRNGQSVAHKGAGVEDQGAGHAAGYAMLYTNVRKPVSSVHRKMRCSLAQERGATGNDFSGGKGIHSGIFLRVHHSRDRDAEVGDWAPEIWKGVKHGQLVGPLGFGGAV